MEVKIGSNFPPNTEQNQWKKELSELSEFLSILYKNDFLKAFFLDFYVTKYRMDKAHLTISGSITL